jgi:hypothetical protein
MLFATQSFMLFINENKACLKRNYMKSIIPMLVLMFMFIDPAFSQDNFKVIKVNGNIVLRTKGTSLETGTVFSEKEDLLFRSEDATAAVINSQRGRMILTNNNHDLATAKSNYLPSMYNISTRGGSLSNLIDLQNHFSGKYVVLGRQSIEMDDSNFPMDNTHFFFLRYAFKGEDINKKLDYSGDTLIIDRKSLYTVDGKPIPSPDNTSIMLFYRKGSESIPINEFDLIFPDIIQLKKEVQIILSEIKDKSSNEKISEINSYINEFYGKVYRGNLVSWLKGNFGFNPE